MRPQSMTESLSLLLDGRLDAAEADALQAEIERDPKLAEQYRRISRARDLVAASAAIDDLPSGFDARLGKRLHRAKLEERVEAKVQAMGARRRAVVNWVASGFGGLAAGMALAFGVVSMLTPTSFGGSPAPGLDDLGAERGAFSTASADAGVEVEAASSESALLELTRRVRSGDSINPNYLLNSLSALERSFGGSSAASQSRVHIVEPSWQQYDPDRLRIGYSRLRALAEEAYESGRPIDNAELAEIIQFMFSTDVMSMLPQADQRLQRYQFYRYQALESDRSVERSSEGLLEEGNPMQAAELLIQRFQRPAATLDENLHQLKAAVALLVMNGQRDVAIDLVYFAAMKDARYLTELNEHVFKQLKVEGSSAPEMIRDERAALGRMRTSLQAWIGIPPELESADQRLYQLEEFRKTAQQHESPGQGLGSQR